ncbi:MAG TPA: hypothetical protein VNU93_08140, partial [Verrucomicrobiae bacterium]|nr:hypothetical protein [Verrucomicrobiae bacterium]
SGGRVKVVVLIYVEVVVFERRPVSFVAVYLRIDDLVLESVLMIQDIFQKRGSTFIEQLLQPGIILYLRLSGGGEKKGSTDKREKAHTVHVSKMKIIPRFPITCTFAHSHSR